MSRSSLPLAAALTVAGATGASAAHLDYYAATLDALNGSGASARASLAVDAIKKTLKVRILARGVEAGQAHAQHIHGKLDADGTLANSVSPTLDDDADGDGFIEVAEGFPAYGGIILPLTMDDGMFPSPTGTSYDFMETYDLTDPSVFGEGFGLDDLLGVGDELEIADMPMLDLREIVIHGLTVPAGAGAGTDGEVDGTGGYKGFLPVAAGEIVSVEMPAPVPLPAAGWAMLAGLGGLGALRRLRRS